jgi:hypothetical protein
MSQNAPKTLMLFIDGLGLGPRHPEINPLHGGTCPRLERLLDECARPVDATLDVAGMPQSATGQAAMLTGVNAAAHMGRHVEGCPGPTLREVVREHNLYDRLMARGYRATFANAYYVDDLDQVLQLRRQSVSTVAALKAFGTVRTARDLEANRAVYQDLTRRALRHRGYEGPLVSPATAAEHLVDVAGENDFTLFEYFQTDLMAHRGTEDDVRRVLTDLDELLGTLLPLWSRPGHLFVLLSDHGNVEDLRTRGHTDNPVPLVALGQGADHLVARVHRLTDFTPALLDLYPSKGEDHEGRT